MWMAGSKRSTPKRCWSIDELFLPAAGRPFAMRIKSGARDLSPAPLILFLAHLHGLDKRPEQGVGLVRRELCVMEGRVLVCQGGVRPPVRPPGRAAVKRALFIFWQRMEFCVFTIISAVRLAFAPLMWYSVEKEACLNETAPLR